MSWSDIRGHAVQREMFRRAIRRGRLAHAYLFTGPEGIGKRQFALRLAQSLLCQRASEEAVEFCGECHACKMLAAGTHPDLLLVGRPEGKKELTLEVFVGERERRGREGLCYELYLRPVASDRRIAIIDDTDLMNEESANALLKTLEEPPEKSVLILLSENPNALLPTIRSRCQLVRFFPLSRSDVAELLLEQDVVESREEAERIAALSGGSLAMAARLRDPRYRELFESLHRHLASEESRPLEAAAQINEQLDRLGGDAGQKRRNAHWVVAACVEFYRGALRWLLVQREAGGDSSVEVRIDAAGPERAEVPETVRAFAARFDPGSDDDLDWLIDFLERTMQAEDHLDRNVSVSFCVETLFADLARISRKSPSAV
ncbi:MAG TPA: DNA polymerase III subunit delta' [Planctomycetaceae bacterium]|nr:DNA polymerase III subunit delta' [Planctomycetaceae bacterium]